MRTATWTGSLAGAISFGIIRFASMAKCLLEECHNICILLRNRLQ